MLEVFNLLNPSSENENVLGTNLLIDFNISSIHGSNNQPSIHHKLHIAGSRSLSASCRDMLAQLRGRDDDLGIGDIVVGKEDNFE